MKTTVQKIKSRYLSPDKDVAQMRASHEAWIGRDIGRDKTPEYAVRYDVLGQMCAQQRSRENLSLRDLSKIVGLSASTLSRIENGKAADTHHVAALCKWLGIEIERIAGTIQEETPKVLRSILLSDPKLTREQAEALSATVGALYQQLANV